MSVLRCVLRCVLRRVLQCVLQYSSSALCTSTLPSSPHRYACYSLYCSICCSACRIVSCSVCCSACCVAVLVAVCVSVRWLYVPSTQSFVQVCMGVAVCVEIESCGIYEWVMWYLWMSHVAHMRTWNPPRASRMLIYTMGHVTHINESCHAYDWIMSDVRNYHEWVMPDIWMSHVTHMNKSCLTCE